MSLRERLFSPAVFRRFQPKDEEKLVGEFWAGKNDGVFVEVGAYDPVILSQTYHLEQRGWSGGRSATGCREMDEAVGNIDRRAAEDALPLGLAPLLCPANLVDNLWHPSPAPAPLREQ